MQSTGKNEKSKKLRHVCTALFIAWLGLGTYFAADRYLIEHVEIASASSAATVQTGSANSLAGDTSANITTNEDYTADEWNYQSDSKTVSIRKVVEGIGKGQVTYFVADVVLDEVSELESAFAKNEFGTNIIQYTSIIAQYNQALFAINGDYYGFRDDGILIRNGLIYRDSPVRTGLAIYADGSMQIYDETRTDAQTLVDQGVWQTLSFGPALVVDGQAITDFGKVVIDTNFGNRSIQNSNPRTGVGMIAPNHFVFVVVDGRANGYSKGLTLTEFAQLFQDLGCTQAYNLDGGGSSEMYFMGRVVNNPLGSNQERGTSDILFVG